MRWPWQHAKRSTYARFDALLDEIAAEFDRQAALHRRRLDELREALRDA